MAGTFSLVFYFFFAGLQEGHEVLLPAGQWWQFLQKADEPLVPGFSGLVTGFDRDKFRETGSP